MISRLFFIGSTVLAVITLITAKMVEAARMRGHRENINTEGKHSK